MRLLFSLLLIALAYFASANENIAFGSLAALGELGHQVAMISLKDNTQFCGGTLVSKNVVVSAAHCFQDLSGGVGVIAGSVDLTSSVNGVSRRVSKIITHEKYDATNIVNDVAVIILSSDIEESASIKYAKLSAVAPTRGVNLIVSGFGLTEKNTASMQLLKVTVPVTADANCNIPAAQSNAIFCAADGSGKDACQGDSGGPIGKFENGTFVLYGIVSFGPESCGVRGEAFGAYAKVSTYVNWITAAANGNGGKVIVFSHGSTAKLHTVIYSMWMVMVALLFLIVVQQ